MKVFNLLVGGSITLVGAVVGTMLATWYICNHMVRPMVVAAKPNYAARRIKVTNSTTNDVAWSGAGYALQSSYNPQGVLNANYKIR
jgi:hypothetical protein